MCQKVREVQNYVKNKYKNDITFAYADNDIEKDGLEKTYISDIAGVFKRAISLYRSSTNKHDQDDIWVLFVIENSEKNVCD